MTYDTRSAHELHKEFHNCTSYDLSLLIYDIRSAHETLQEIS